MAEAKLMHADLPEDLQALVPPDLDLQGLLLSNCNGVSYLVYDHKDDAVRAWNNGALKCSLSELPNEIGKLVSDGSITFKKATLKEPLDLWDDQYTLPSGTHVHIAEMDRPFYITDGKVRCRLQTDSDLIECSHEAVNGGTPGDFILVADNDKSRVARVSREWVKLNVRYY